MKISLTICGCFALLMLGLFFWREAALKNQPAALTRELSVAADAAIAREGALTRAMIDVRLASMQASVDRQITVSREQIILLADARLKETAKNFNEKLDRTVKILDQRSGQVAADFDSAATSLAEVAKLRSDLQPTVAAVNVTAPTLLRRTGDTISEIRITALETAQTMKTVRDAAPKLLDATVQTTQHFAGIAGDAHRAADKFVKPQPWYKKLWSGVQTVGAILLAHAL